MIIEPKICILKNGLQVQMRSPLVSEASVVLDHLKITHLESYRNLNQGPEYWDHFSVEEEEKILKDHEVSSAKMMIGAFFQGKFIGILSLMGNWGEIQKHSAKLGISIQRAYCGQGIGTQLMNYALVKAKEVGFHRIELSVRTFNNEGIALYEKLGFEKVGILKEVELIDNKYADEYLYQIILK